MSLTVSYHTRSRPELWEQVRSAEELREYAEAIKMATGAGLTRIDGVTT
ncbi:MAG: hypothetical protein M1508_05070 [Nitrospirae bacterium]|nr:hypothetical protein [Nitrospirota bacterium]MCL5423392.1 hypothetical protein [Nitrospirota bacterium]